ncbi:MAG: M48 family metalloprotease [Candidatus Eremiobacteraeota bacterium]|nr:M48 family metalloprotease [Candidatus Eremiobacteraeota bacterium]
MTRETRHAPKGFRPLAGVRILLFVLAALASWGARPTAAIAYPASVDRRVTAIPARALLSEAPARLTDARRQRAAVRFRAYNRPLFFAWALSQVVLLLYLWASGTGARIRDFVRARIRSTFAVRFVYGAFLSLAAALASFPPSLVRYRLDFTFGLTAERAANWYYDGLLNAAIDACVVGVIVACVFALVDRTRLWYLYAMGGLFVVTLLLAFAEPVVVAPLYNRFSPLPEAAPVRARLEALATKAGLGEAPIVVDDTSRRSTGIVADIAGFGPTKRIVLGDALLDRATMGEVLFLSAREFGHYAHGDDFRLSLLWTFLLIFCTAVAVVCADRVGFRRDDDPLARLSLVFAFLGTLGLLVTPLYNAYSRNNESRADAYALALTNDRASAIRAYVRIADETLAPLCPSRAVRLYFYNSPPLGTRIAKVAGRRDPCE